MGNNWVNFFSPWNHSKNYRFSDDFRMNRSEIWQRFCRKTLRKTCPNTEFFWSVFSCIQTEYGDLTRKSPYSVQIQENMDQKKLSIGHFSRSDTTQRIMGECVRAIKHRIILSFHRTIYDSLRNLVLFVQF